MEAVAKLKNCPMSARKMRLVADSIRNMEANKALDVLRFTQKEAAGWLEKLVLSAVSNWGQKTNQDPESFDLYIKTILVDEGPSLKRFRPAPYGRAHRIRKRTNHVTLIVENRVFLETDELELEENYDEEE